MISSKEELKFYIQADRMMNRGSLKKSIKMMIINFFMPDYIMKYLETLRKVEYYSYRNYPIQYWYKFKLNKLSYKTGLSIASNVFGYGLVVPHHGTIVVGSGNRIGNYCVLHTSICITAGNKHIGNAFYCSTGSRILGDVELGDNVTVGANAVVNKSESSNRLLTGIPAQYKRDAGAWYLASEYLQRVEICNDLKNLIFNRV